MRSGLSIAPSMSGEVGVTSPNSVDRLGWGLAASLPLLGLVVVSPTRPARVIWRNGELAPGVLDTLTVLARDLMVGRVEHTNGARAAVDDGGVHGRLVLDSHGAAHGVLFGVLAGAQAWTDTGRALLELALVGMSDELLHILDRPRPSSGPPLGCPVLVAELREAVDRGELTLLYQPEIDLRSGQILALEALVRWEHPARGRLGPESFIAVAERSDVIKVVGAWIFDRALCEFARFADQTLSLRVNVSLAQLSGEGIVGLLVAALDRYHVPARQVCIEFTETSSGSDPADLHTTLSALNELGVGSAIDDLATGYSTLSRLRFLPVDTIKIDRSLVTGIDQDLRAQAIVRALVRMAHDLGLEVVGEGVENAAVARTLLDLGCHRGQGHHLGVPQTPEAIGSLLREHTHVQQ